jgi:hypothetical protein
MMVITMYHLCYAQMVCVNGIASLFVLRTVQNPHMQMIVLLQHMLHVWVYNNQHDTLFVLSLLN